MALSVIGSNPAVVDTPQAPAGTAPFTTRTAHRISHAATTIKLVFANFGDGGYPHADVNGPNAYSLKVAVERAGPNGVNAQNQAPVAITFGGAATVTIAPGAIVESDEIAFATAAGENIFVRAYANGLGGLLPTNGSLSGSTNDPRDYDNGEGFITGDFAYSGQIPPSGQGYPALCVKPHVILGDTGAVIPSVCKMGDSIAQGYGDSGLQDDDRGFMTRALLRQTTYSYDKTNVAVPLGYVDATRGGETLAAFAALATNQHRLLIASYAANVWCFLGHNDLVDLAAFKANYLRLANYFGAKGIKLFACTLTPACTSTDKFFTSANQAVTPNEAFRLAQNAWLRDTTATGFVAQCQYPAFAATVEVGGLVECDGTGNVVLNGGFWPPNGRNAVEETGIATSANTGLTYDTTKNWIPQQWAGYGVYITAGTGVGTMDQSTLNYPAAIQGAVTVDTTSHYALRKIYVEDGNHPATLSNQIMATALQGLPLLPFAVRPPAPASLAAAAPIVSVVLTWPAAATALYYRVRKDGVTTPIYDGAGLTLTDTFALGTSHTYTVTAYNTAGESALTAPATAMALAASLSLTVTPGTGVNNLAWISDPQAANGYAVLWMPGSALPVVGATGEVVARVAQGTLAWADTSAYRIGLTAGSRYDVISLR